MKEDVDIPLQLVVDNAAPIAKVVKQTKSEFLASCSVFQASLSHTQLSGNKR